MHKTKKTSFFILAIVFIALAAVYISNQVLSFAGNRIVSVEINNHIFQVEVVAKNEKMQKGLGGRDVMCENCGMLFKFQEPGRHSFWMNDMKFPLDIVWIFQGSVVHIEKNVKPDFIGILTSIENADAVLEINGGSADKFEIKIGDMISF